VIPTEKANGPELAAPTRSATPVKEGLLIGTRVHEGTGSAACGCHQGPQNRAPLGTSRTSVAGHPKTAGQGARRRERNGLREKLRKVTRSARQAACGRHARGEWVEVVVKDGVAHFAGIKVCGLVWTCPVCGPKIRQGRAVEIGAALGAALAGGYGVEFLTLTGRHHQGQRLAWLYGGMERAWADVKRSQKYRAMRDRLGLVGYVQVREITHGENGWHPHRHLGVVFRHPLSDGERDEFEQVMWELWDVQLRKQGLDSLRGPGCLVNKVTAAEGLGWYLTKVNGGPVGLEMARGDLKGGRDGGRTPEQILRDAVATGDVADVKLFKEYEAATFSRRMVSWSDGLRRLLIGQAVDEVTDEELAEAEVGGEKVAVVDCMAWKSLRAASPGAVAVLEAAEVNAAVLEAYLRAVVPLGCIWWVVEALPSKPG